MLPGAAHLQVRRRGAGSPRLFTAAPHHRCERPEWLCRMGALPSGAMQRRCGKGHTEPIAPQNHAVDSRGVGAAGYDVVGVTAVGPQGPEIEVAAATKPSKPLTSVHYSRIAEPYTRLGTLRGVQLLDPQYPSIVEHGPEPSSAGGSVDVTGELS